MCDSKWDITSITLEWISCHSKWGMLSITLSQQMGTHYVILNRMYVFINHFTNWSAAPCAHNTCDRVYMSNLSRHKSLPYAIQTWSHLHIPSVDYIHLVQPSCHEAKIISYPDVMTWMKVYLVTIIHASMTMMNIHTNCY